MDGIFHKSSHAAAQIAASDRAGDRKPALLLVHGAADAVGKTAVLYELHRPFEGHGPLKPVGIGTGFTADPVAQQWEWSHLETTIRVRGAPTYAGR
ncbi:hypothetical protein H4P1_00068 (plasmid) [Variovorax sp. PBS-H4]|uniref:hypothetical protein n=1 Tax=Variovorax sp. PBS-H4 TaxID=434008 RepID=UPI0013176FB4|nr:hypothetical protein [Variovorax sp. PBS-H4]VTU41436.1 hypothetical protein H4P1_00068 [Variovorax sp. PBS-H4]